MIQVFKIDINNFYLFKTYMVEQPNEFEITTPINTNLSNTFYKPKWDSSNKIWVEGWTQEEIEEFNRQEEANRPPQEPNEMEVLEGRVGEIENINAGLLLENAGHQIKIQEQEKMNKEQEVTNANLLLEIAMLKGAVL